MSWTSRTELFIRGGRRLILSQQLIGLQYLNLPILLDMEEANETDKPTSPQPLDTTTSHQTPNPSTNTSISSLDRLGSTIATELADMARYNVWEAVP